MRSAHTTIGLFVLASALFGCQPNDDPAPRPPELIASDAAGIQQAIADARGDVVLVNVWATWCQPCREEFPDLMQVLHESQDQGLSYVLVCADFPDQVDAARKFLAAQGVDFPSYLKTGKDMPFIDTFDPEWSGALPATWIFDRDGKRRFFWENKVSYQVLRERVDAVLAP